MSAAIEETDDELVGRCYTKARRTPLVHGVIRDVNGGRGIRLPFGPYTLTQLAAIVVTFVLLILGRPIWGGHGLVDWAVLLVVPFGIAFTLRHLHVDGRNPAAAAASVAVMLAGPRWGQLHGRPFRPVRPKHTDTLITVASPATADATEPPLTAPAPSPAARPIRTARPLAAPATPAAPPAAGAGAPVASGVQALLARRTASAARPVLED